MRVGWAPPTIARAQRAQRLVLLAFACAAPGCSNSWKPELAEVQTAPATMQVDLAQRMPSGPYRAVFSRTSSQHKDITPQRYTVQSLPGLQREGAFADIEFASLDPFVPGGRMKAQPRRFTWPRWRKGAAGMMLRFDPPLDYLPRRMEADETVSSSARMQVFNAKGAAVSKGKAERTVRLEGYATARAGGKRYTDCLCVRTETRVQVSWMARLALTEYLYLAPGRGLVRRVQRLRGRVLMRRFDDVIEDELVQFEQLSPKPAEAAKDAPPTAWTAGTWSAAVFFFQPGMPQPYLAGAVIDYSADQPSAIDD